MTFSFLSTKKLQTQHQLKPKPQHKHPGSRSIQSPQGNKQNAQKHPPAYKTRTATTQNHWKHSGRVPVHKPKHQTGKLKLNHAQPIKKDPSTKQPQKNLYHTPNPQRFVFPGVGVGVGVGTAIALGIGLGVGLGTGVGSGVGSGSAASAAVASLAVLSAEGSMRRSWGFWVWDESWRCLEGFYRVFYIGITWKKKGHWFLGGDFFFENLM